jgi:hypothetical protein
MGESRNGGVNPAGREWSSSPLFSLLYPHIILIVSLSLLNLRGKRHADVTKTRAGQKAVREARKEAGFRTEQTAEGWVWARRRSVDD